MTLDDAFLQAIVDAPDDDVPRLIYCDWLEEHGQPSRAAFIRVQIALARLPDDDPRRGELEARERGLLKQYGPRWAAPVLNPLAGMVTRYTLRRGFIEELAVEARGLLLHADTLFRLAPLQHLEVYLAGGRIGALASLPYLSRLVALNLGQNSLGDAGACTLASAPHLDRLETLTLWSNGIGDAGVQALAACRGLSQLTYLDLSGNSVGDAGALALACGFPRLASLQFYGNRIGQEGRKALQARFGDRVKLSEQ